MKSDRNSSKTDLFISLLLINSTFRQVMCKKTVWLTRIRSQEQEFSDEDEIISSQFIASRKVSIFKLFPSDCITLYSLLKTIQFDIFQILWEGDRSVCAGARGCSLPSERVNTKLCGFSIKYSRIFRGPLNFNF